MGCRIVTHCPEGVLVVDAIPAYLRPGCGVCGAGAPEWIARAPATRRRCGIGSWSRYWCRRRSWSAASATTRSCIGKQRGHIRWLPAINRGISALNRFPVMPAERKNFAHGNRYTHLPRRGTSRLRGSFKGHSETNGDYDSENKYSPFLHRRPPWSGSSRKASGGKANIVDALLQSSGAALAQTSEDEEDEIVLGFQAAPYAAPTG